MDERADETQRQALGQIFSGARGGPPASISAWSSFPSTGSPASWVAAALLASPAARPWPVPSRPCACHSSRMANSRTGLVLNSRVLSRDAAMPHPSVWQERLAVGSFQLPILRVACSQQGHKASEGVEGQ